MVNQNILALNQRLFKRSSKNRATYDESLNFNYLVCLTTMVRPTKQG